MTADASMEDNANIYQPNRILVLILEELNEDIINSPMTSLLTSNTCIVDIVSCHLNFHNNM